MKRKILVAFSALLVILIIIAGIVYAAPIETSIFYPKSSDEDLDITKDDVNSDSDVIEEEKPSNANFSDMEYWDAQDGIPATAGVGAGCDIFLKLSGIEGSSTDARHTRQIDILSYSLGGRSEPGKTVYKAFRINKMADKSSPKLFQAMIDGDNISSAIFEIRKTGASQDIVMKITLSDVSVISYKQYSTSSCIGLEEVLLSYSRIDFSYYTYNNGTPTEFKASGSLN